MSSALNIGDLIDHARTCVRLAPDAKVKEEIGHYTRLFDEQCAVSIPGALNIFAFHVDVPDSHRVINYVDVTHDHGTFDYRKLAAHLIWAGASFTAGVHTLFITNETCPAPPSQPGLSVIRLPMDDRIPMRERVKAMAAYVQSKAFNQDTVFLDTDAFPNRDLKRIFDRRFDIGVTYRTTPGYMPLNEGVIFCSRANPGAAVRFFLTYNATYESLAQDPVVIGYYGDVGRWRGGQLSLNGIACPPGNLNKVGAFESEGVKIGLLPCNTFNYWVTRKLAAGAKSWDRKYILHLKGDSKRLVDHVIDYQLDRHARRRVA
jgi:hypothetical protein